MPQQAVPSLAPALTNASRGSRRGSARWRRILCVSTLVSASVVIPALPAQATFAGDNGRIAFRRFLNEERTWGAVFTIRPNGTGERQVTFPPYGYVDRNPDFSPDGTRIAFEREGVDAPDGIYTDEVWVVDANGSHLKQLTHNQPGVGCDNGGTCDGQPGWSPDGKRIAFSRAAGPVDETGTIENVGIFVMRADGEHIHRLTQFSKPGKGEDTNPQFSPDGTKILFQRSNVRDTLPLDGVAIWVRNLVTGREHRVTPWRLRAGDTPDWSPDGKRILFHDNLDGPADVSANLYTIRPSGKGLKQLTFETGGTVNYLGSSFSPDGLMITFGRRPETGGTNADVLVMRADGTHVRYVTRTELYDSYPDWGVARS